tara:strand:+ start:33 stop:512 length:480 start_codon:yes stop_codon:yes gene_type:complete
MINLSVSIRIYLTDVLKSDMTDELIPVLNSVSPKINAAKLYLWYNEDDLTQHEIKEFLLKWDSTEHNNFKTIIRPHYFDNQNDFIWWDIIPKKVLEDLPIGNTGMRNYYTRFEYRYHEPSSIITGLEKFQETYDFVTTDKSKPIRKQKRNDGEDSNNRK